MVINISKSESQITFLGRYLLQESPSNVKLIGDTNPKRLATISSMVKYVIASYFRPSEAELCLNNSPWSLIMALFSNSKRKIVWLHDNEPHSESPPIGEKISRSLLYLIVKSRNVEFFVAFKSQTRNLPVWMHKTPVFPLSLPAVKEIYDWDAKTGDRQTTSLHDSDYLIFFGRLDEYKGLSKLEEIAQIVFPMHIVVAGNGKYQFKSQNIQRLGFVPDSELGQLIKNSDGVLFPYISGTGTQAIQTALKLGKKVLASKICMFEENFNLEGVWFFEPDADLIELTESVCIFLKQELNIEPYSIFETEVWAANVLQKALNNAP